MDWITWYGLALKRDGSRQSDPEVQNQTSRVNDLANLPAGFSWKPSNLHTVSRTPWTRVGTVRSSKGIALTRPASELDSQARSVQHCAIYPPVVNMEKRSRAGYVGRTVGYQRHVSSLLLRSESDSTAYQEPHHEHPWDLHTLESQSQS